MWLILVVLLGLCQAAWGQSPYDTWYFGSNAALRFPTNGGAPVPLPGSAMQVAEGCVSFSDGAG